MRHPQMFFFSFHGQLLFFVCENYMNNLKEQKRWICWDWKETPDGKKTKVPMSTRGGYASSTNPDTWSTYEEAKQASEMFAGIGIVFIPEQDLLGIDIDHVIDENGEMEKEIGDFIYNANTYTEVSPSGDGLHLYLALEEPLELTSNKKAPYEVYTSGRFFTFTENDFGAHKEIRTVSKKEALDILSTIGYPWKVYKVRKDIPQGDDQYPDQEIMTKIFRSKNGLEMHDLYNNESKKYSGDKSSEDFALVCSLAFWTQRNFQQIERIWLASPLGQRAKTKDRPDYRIRTIEAAISVTDEVYTPSRRPRTDTFTPTPSLTSKLTPNA